MKIITFKPFFLLIILVYFICLNLLSSLKLKPTIKVQRIFENNIINERSIKNSRKESNHKIENIKSYSNRINLNLEDKTIKSEIKDESKSLFERIFLGEFGLLNNLSRKNFIHSDYQ